MLNGRRLTFGPGSLSTPRLRKEWETLRCACDFPNKTEVALEKFQNIQRWQNRFSHVCISLKVYIKLTPTVNFNFYTLLNILSTATQWKWIFFFIYFAPSLQNWIIIKRRAANFTPSSSNISYLEQRTRIIFPWNIKMSCGHVD